MRAYIDDKKKIIIKNIMHKVAFYVVAFIVFTAFFCIVGNTESRQQHRLMNLLDDNFADYNVLDVHGNAYSSDDEIDFDKFYISSNDTLYKCKYIASQNELYMEKVSELPVILRGDRDGEKE